MLRSNHFRMQLLVSCIFLRADCVLGGGHERQCQHTQV
jgi:hypothetical protein